MMSHSRRAILHRRNQIIEQFSRLLGRPSVGALVVWNFELVAAFEDFSDQLVVRFKRLGYYLMSFPSIP